MESSDRWLEGLDGLRNVCVGRRLGRLNEPGDEVLACTDVERLESRGGGGWGLEREVLGTRGSRLRTAVSRTFMTSDFGIGRAAAFFATFLPTFVRVLSGMTTRVCEVCLRERGYGRGWCLKTRATPRLVVGVMCITVRHPARVVTPSHQARDRDRADRGPSTGRIAILRLTPQDDSTARDDICCITRHLDRTGHAMSSRPVDAAFYRPYRLPATCGMVRLRPRVLIPSVAVMIEALLATACGGTHVSAALPVGDACVLIRQFADRGLGIHCCDLARRRAECTASDDMG